MTITKRGMKTPLGVLSVAQLDKGEMVLEAMEEELNNASPSSGRLEALSSEFYTKIPVINGVFVIYLIILLI